MTQTRWWAPSGPHVGLDDADLGMLRAGGSSPRLDLGAALVAAHRVGAAALEDAARSPLVDSGTVIQKLADARARLGIPMSESISKSVGDRRYAYLLVRDLLDDADMAAHDLFRAAVAKRVAPSTAAARAAAVYGVDARGLGQYRQLAIDPRANPQAVTDAADRALFEYIEKIADSESDEREEVSKAPAAEQERPATQVKPDDPGTDYYDARSAGGQFAPRVGQPGMLARLRSRYGIGGQEAPTVDTGRPSERVEQETPSPGKAKSLAEIRRQRVNRAQAQQNRQRAQARPQQAQQTLRGQTLRSQQARKQTKLTQQQKKQLTKVAAKSSIIWPDTERILEPAQAQLNHPFLDRVDARPENYRMLDQEMIVHATEAQAMDFFSRLATSPGYVARVGHLFERTGANSVEESGTRTAGEQLRGYARMADGQDPGTVYISADDLAGFETLAQQEDYLEGKRQELAWRNGRLDRGRLEHISVLPSNDDEGMVVVDESDTIAQGTPTVFEFVVIDGVGRVDSGEGNKHMQWSLDPNQAYKFSRPQDWETTFDYEHGVLVKRIYAQHVDERGVHEYKSGIRKAAAEAERPLTSVQGLAVAEDGTRYYNVRDDQGQFALSGGTSIADRLRQRPVQQTPSEPAEESPVRQSLVARRRQRVNRAQAQQARQRSRLRSQSQAPLTQRQQTQRQQTQRQQTQQARQQQTLAQKVRQQHLARIVRQVVATGERNTVFNDHADYTVLSEREARDNFGINPDQPNSENTGVTPENEDYLTELRATGDEISGLVAEQSIDPIDTEQVAILDYPRDDEGQAGLMGVVDRFLEQPDVGLVVAKPLKGTDMIEVRINKKPTTPVIVIEFAEDYDAGRYSSDGMSLQFASRSTVLHDEQLDDGTVRSYRVPIIRYLATPSRNARGRR
jgi:hypothetical protein